MERGSFICLLAILISNNNALTTFGRSPIPTKSLTLEEYDNALLPNLSVCGVVKENLKIYGGIATALGEMPWIAALKYNTTSDDEDQEVLCTGSLIHQSYVLTAGSCIRTKAGKTPVKVVLGEWNFKTDPDCINNECADPVQKIKIQSVIFHQHYGARSGENDIALLRLENDAVFTEFVNPICLPRKNLPFPGEGQHVTVAGWGLTEQGRLPNILLKVSLPIASNEECGKKLNKEIKDTRFCAGGVQGKDSCQGDSGSPAIAIYGDDINQVRWYQRGIVSSGIGCGVAGYAGIYTKVDKYMDWIVTNIKKNNSF